MRGVILIRSALISLFLAASFSARATAEPAIG